MDKISRKVPGSVDRKSQNKIMTGQEFKGLGMAQTAYLRPACHDGVNVVAIHAADGTPIAVAEDEASAVEVILQSKLIPSFLQ
ncbi:DUF1150 family protein [Aristophania vespae]|uniref:DUF1150 family protein n=1 Tax=Aristophania vespae TaxID=2697033 RepID=A0A6P1N9U4_9PROT|nr:DUF1150 family protein [Aristophania vespae]QHI95355.1 DUF1150 family protein [Aristophania vespae]